METKLIFKNKNISESEIKKSIFSYFGNVLKYDISSNDIHYETICVGDFSIYIVVLKKSINSITSNTHKGWDIFAFSLIDGKQYEQFFGRNINKKPIIPLHKFKSFDNFEYALGTAIYKGNNPNDLFIDNKIISLFQNFIFNLLYKTEKHLFLNTNFYSVINIIENHENAISSTFNYNSKHEFKKTNMQQKSTNETNFNTSYIFIKNVKEELNRIEKHYVDMVELINAYEGKLPLTPVTSYNYNCIKQGIEDNNNFIITEGMARTGKTIIALRLLGNYREEANLVIMNQHFYKSLKNAFILEKVEFPFKSIITHTRFADFEKARVSSKILIIDEAQRLNEYQIDNIINSNKNNINVFLGDNLQKLNYKHDKGLDFLERKLKSLKLDVQKHYFTHSIGIAPNILQSIKYLLFKDTQYTNQSINKYEINFFKKEEKKLFLKKYFDDSTYKKHMATIYMCDGDYDVTIDGFKRVNIKNQNLSENYFFDEYVKEHIMLTTFELISREVDSMYIFIPETVYIKKGYGNENGYLSYIGSNQTNNLEEYMLNQLYILMTRSKGSINILCENETVYEYFQNRISKLKNQSSESIELFEEEKEKSEKLKNILNSKGITRLIHFTSFGNLESIKQKGILSVNELEKNKIPYIKNDFSRNDKILNGISLSIQNPNWRLLKTYKDKHPQRKYFAILLDPALLYEITDSTNKKLALRYYCNYNAAAKVTKKSTEDIDIMFEDLFVGNCWIATRDNKEDSSTTTDQAEILFCEKIDPKYILEIKEI